MGTKSALRIVVLILLGFALSFALVDGVHLLLPPLHGVDVAVEYGVHAHTSPALELLARIFTFVGRIAFFLPLAAASALYLAWKGIGHAARVLAGAIAGAIVLNDGLKLVFHRPRPMLPWSLGDEHTFSFPSGHTLFATVLCGIAAHLVLRHWRRSARWTLGERVAIVLPAVLLAACIAGSRIVLGMHWLTDILAGFVAGGVWLATVLFLDRPGPDATAGTAPPPPGA